MNKTVITCTIAAMLAIVACKKEDEITPNPPTSETFSSIADFYNANTVPVSFHTIDAAIGGSFTTSKGSIVTVPTNAFITQSGGAVTGDVTLTMKEVFSTSDIIYSGVFPVAYDYFLNSGGEYFLNATQAGNTLSVNPGAMINVEIPAQAEDPGMMLLFADGDVEGLDSLGWQFVDSASASQSGFTFSSVDDSYSIDLDSLGWGNIDAFDWTVSYFTCSFQLDGLTGLNSLNTTAYAVFKNQNTVWPIGTNGWGSIASNIASDSHLAAIDMNVLVISVIDDQLYYGVLDITPAASQTYNITMTATTSDDLNTIINALP
jgi:hypothetical protein